jgi:DNA-binding MarR family transcriptional regulator
MLRLRRLRADYFGNDLFSDPAWDILLELYATEVAGGRIAGSALAAVIDVPATTVLRWLRRLEADGWVRREDDQLDGRRMWLHLSKQGISRIEAYLDAWSSWSV